MVSAVNPYLNFPGNTEAAFEFYRTVFGGELVGPVRYRDFPDAMGAADADRDRIAHVGLPIGAGHILMGTDSIAAHGKTLRTGNNFYITLGPDDAEEARRLFDALSDGGRIEMPLQETEWAELYGICADRFDVQWMISFEGAKTFRFG